MTKSTEIQVDVAFQDVMNALPPSVEPDDIDKEKQTVLFSTKRGFPCDVMLCVPPKTGTVVLASQFDPTPKDDIPRVVDLITRCNHGSAFGTLAIDQDTGATRFLMMQFLPTDTNGDVRIEPTVIELGVATSFACSNVFAPLLAEVVSGKITPRAAAEHYLANT